MAAETQRAQRMNRGLLLATILASSAFAQQPAPAATPSMIVGRVVDTMDTPFARANVELVGLGRVTTTGDGIFVFKNVPPGDFLLRAGALGYSPTIRVVKPRGDDTLIVTMVMARAVAMVPIVVRAESTITARSDPTGFLWRQLTGMGTYLNALDIERIHPANVEQLVKNISGIQVINGGIRFERESQSFRNPCNGAQVLLDGVALSEGFDLNQLPLDAIRGVEVYKSVATIPAELHASKNTCGVVALWTRAR